MADGLVAMGFGPEQAEAALALCDGDAEGALEILLNAVADEQQQPAVAPAAPRPAEAAEPTTAPLADDKLELLVAVAGCTELAAAKALAKARGDVEAASQQMLEREERPAGQAADAVEASLLSHKQLVWALRGSWATRGLLIQLEAICGGSGDRLQPYMRSTVTAALLRFLEERPADGQREGRWRDTAAWACRVLNGVADGPALLRLTTVELLLDCLAVDADAGAAAVSSGNASGSCNDVLCSVLRRIGIESQGEPELRQASCAPVLVGTLQLIASFAAANTRSPLPSACQTAMELARGLAQDEAVMRNVWPSEQMVQSLSTVLRHRDDDCQAQIGGLDILHGLVGAYSRARNGMGVSPELLALLTSENGALLSVLLSVVAAPPGASAGDASAGVCVVYSEVCALLCELVSANSLVSDSLCVAPYGDAATPPPAATSTDLCLLDYYRGSTNEPQVAAVYYGVLQPEPEPEPELGLDGDGRGVGILQAILSAFDADVGGSAVCDAAVALLSAVALVRFNGHIAAQRKLQECVGVADDVAEDGESAGLILIESPVVAMEEVQMQFQCIFDVFCRCAHSWSMDTSLQMPRAAMSFSAVDAEGWGSHPSDDAELARGWVAFAAELLPALVAAHYRHARTCSFLSVMLSCMHGDPLPATAVEQIAPPIARITRELLSHDSPPMTVMALHLVEALLKCSDGPTASVAAVAFARQGIDEAIREAAEVDQDETVMGCMARCQEAFERAEAVEPPPGGLQGAQVRVSLEVVARQLASGKTEVLSELHDMLLCLGVTDYEAEHAGLFTSLRQLVISQGVEVLLDQLDGPSLRLIIDLLQVSIACMPLPIYRLPANMRGAGDGLACLFQPLAVRFWRGGSGDTEHTSGLFEPIVSVAELEQHLLRKVAIRNPKFLAYCRDIVGCWIEDCEKDREGNGTKRVAYVVGFDETACEHTVLYETNVSPPLVRSKFARSQHSVISGRHQERKAVTEAKQAAEAAREASSSGWKALFGASTAQTLLGVRVAAHCVPTIHTDDSTQRWRPATVVANQTTGRSAVSLVYDDDASGTICNVEIIGDDSNRSVIRLSTDPVADSSDGCQWQWLGDGDWINFSDDASRQLELSRQNGSHGCALMLGDEQLVVEFKTMVQRDESQRERPIRRAASSINLWSAIERPRAGSDEARRRALSESDAVEDSDDADDDGIDVGSYKPTIPVLVVTLKGLRGYVESGSPHASDGRVRSLDDSDGTLSPEGRPEASDDSSPINGEMTLFQCIMNTAGGNLFDWEQTWSVDYEVTVDGLSWEEETDVEPQLPEAVPETKSPVSAEAYVVSGSTLQQINGRYDRSDSQEVHEHPVYVGSSEVSGKYLYWQPNHEGEWVIADDIGKGYRAVNRTQSVCAYEDGCPSKDWHVWNGPRREWTDEVSVTLEKVGSPPVEEPTQTNLRVEFEEAQDALDADSETDSKEFVVAVTENQRCKRGGTFTSDALLPSERGKWTDCDGNSLPDPHSEPNPPEGWTWAPDSGWQSTGWFYSVSFATHASHWTSDPITTLGSKSVVRRCRWERHIARLPPPPTTPRTPAKALSLDAKQTHGPPAELVRKMLSDGSVNFQRKWGLDRPGTAELIAGQMGERVLQAFRDFEGSSFASAEANQEEWRRSFGADGSPGPPGYSAALARPVAAVPPPPSYSAIMSGSALPAKDVSFDDDLFAAVMGSPMPKAQLLLEPEPKPETEPEPEMELPPSPPLSKLVLAGRRRRPARCGWIQMSICNVINEKYIQVSHNFPLSFCACCCSPQLMPPNGPLII